jgi:hypothetical protein
MPLGEKLLPLDQPCPELATTILFVAPQKRQDKINKHVRILVFIRDMLDSLP